MGGRSTGSEPMTVYPNIHEWTDQTVRETYYRLSRDLHQRGWDQELITRMSVVEDELDERGIDSMEIAIRAQEEAKE